MLVKKILVVFLVFIWVFPAFADMPPTPLAEGLIKIDGDSSDWKGIPAFKNSFGGPKKGSDTVDVRSFHMGFTKSAYFFKAVVDPALNSFSPKEDTSILQIMFDKDANDSTGNRTASFYRVSPKGFETRFELLVLKNKNIVGRLYSSENDFKNLIKEWKIGSENLAVKGEVVEFKIPFETIKFTPSQGMTEFKLFLIEYSNRLETSNIGYSKIALKLDFAALDKIKAVPATSDASSGSGFTIWHLIVLTIWVVSILCSISIAPKAGLSMGVALINLIPFLGQLAFLFILAFGQWPMHKDYQKLEDRLREFNDEV